jgi:hyperosmotically inducible periplasmic protein
MPSNPRWSLLIILILAVYLMACSSTRSSGMQIDDSAISATVKARMAADSDISPFNIDVDTNEGVVILRGYVGKPAARTKAEELAKETDGVRRVINLITVADAGGGGDPCYAPKCPCKDGTCKESCCKSVFNILGVVEDV